MRATWITSEVCPWFQTQRYLACTPTQTSPKTSRRPTYSSTAYYSHRCVTHLQFFMIDTHTFNCSLGQVGMQFFIVVIICCNKFFVGLIFVGGENPWIFLPTKISTHAVQTGTFASNTSASNMQCIIASDDLPLLALYTSHVYVPTCFLCIGCMVSS